MPVSAPTRAPLTLVGRPRAGAASAVGGCHLVSPRDTLCSGTGTGSSLGPLARQHRAGWGMELFLGRGSVAFLGFRVGDPQEAVKSRVGPMRPPDLHRLCLLHPYFKHFFLVAKYT